MKQAAFKELILKLLEEWSGSYTPDAEATIEEWSDSFESFIWDSIDFNEASERRQDGNDT